VELPLRETERERVDTLVGVREEAGAGSVSEFVSEAEPGTEAPSGADAEMLETSTESEVPLLFA
jgi:hypothetical protein